MLQGNTNAKLFSPAKRGTIIFLFVFANLFSGGIIVELTDEVLRFIGNIKKK
jgi:hypothetical protein